MTGFTRSAAPALIQILCLCIYLILCLNVPHEPFCMKYMFQICGFMIWWMPGFRRINQPDWCFEELLRQSKMCINDPSLGHVGWVYKHQDQILSTSCTASSLCTLEGLTRLHGLRHAHGRWWLMCCTLSVSEKCRIALLNQIIFVLCTAYCTVLLHM